MKVSFEKKSGFVASTVTLAYTGLSLPAQIIKIYETNDVSGISVFMLIMMTITFLSWTIYASVKQKTDWFIFIPNGVGFVCAAIILIQVLSI